MLLLAVATAGVLRGEATTDWPQFRGPSGQGLSEARNPPRSWSKDEGVDWKVEVPGSGWSSPVLKDGKIVITAASRDGEKAKLGVLQFEARTGKLAWEKWVFTPSEEEVEAVHAKNSLASGTPIIAGGVVYVHFAHMGTAALDFGSGDVIWRHHENYPPVHGTGSSPVLVDGMLVFNVDGRDNPAVVALDARTGNAAWKTGRNVKVKRNFSFSTPLVIEHGGRRLVLSAGSGMVGAYDPLDGKLAWRVRYGEGYSVVPRPLFADGTVYVATGFGKPHLLAIDPDGARGDVTESHVLWDVDRNVPKTPSVVAGHGHIYMVDDTGRVSCLDGTSGETRWSDKLAGNFSSSPVLAGNILYACSEDGVCFVMEVSPTKGKVISEIEMEDRIFASPAVIDGAIILRSETTLWRISGG
jgi:outer membrane protein assembly factor BamB